MKRHLKIVAWTCCLVLFWVSCTFAGQKAVGEKGAPAPVPVMVIEEPTFDFGQVTQGEPVKHDFRVINKGKAPLEIKKVKPG